ncbi:MAG: dephospho-CoA kinase [Thermoleophilia bacterium]|nr:dephospho-CoA kinase [Thermoleophilia bacterium]
MGEPRATPRCLGLTGGIGAGKSTALAAFAAAGAATQSSDQVVHDLYLDPEVIAAVRERFGDDVLDPDGTVDRRRLGALAFAQEGGVAFLERLLHPRIGPARDRWIAQQRALPAPPPLLVCEVPLLFESGLADGFDAVLVVTAGERLRRRRVQERGQDFDARAARQWSEADKIAAADEVFENDGSLSDLHEWVADVVRRYARPTA